jgi:hypothetical protein
MKLYHEILTNEVSDWLLNKKIKFELDNSDDNHFFTFWIGSGVGNIQIEYLPIESISMPFIQLFTRIGKNDNNVCENVFEYNGDFKELTLKIEELIDNIKRINRVIHKIEDKIDQIKELCEDIQIDYEQFIIINHEF